MYARRTVFVQMKLIEGCYTFEDNNAGGKKKGCKAVTQLNNATK